MWQERWVKGKIYTMEFGGWVLPTGLRIQLAPTLSSLTVNSSKFLAAVHCCARALILRQGCEERRPSNGAASWRRRLLFFSTVTFSCRQRRLSTQSSLRFISAAPSCIDYLTKLRPVYITYDRSDTAVNISPLTSMFSSKTCTVSVTALLYISHWLVLKFVLL